MRDALEAAPGLFFALLWGTSFFIPIVHPDADKLDVVLGFVVPMYGWCWLLWSSL